MIRIIGLCKAFSSGKDHTPAAEQEGTAAARKQVLTGVNLTIDGPTVLMGPSGQGKTTLLRILMGLEQPDAGQIEGLAGRRIAAMFQEDRLCPQLTAGDNICLTGRGVTRAQAEEELRGLGFSNQDLKTPAARLSGGQKRRTALLRALLCCRTDLLFLDEPFTGMDDALVDRAAAAVVRLTAGRDALLVTHDHEAARLLGWPVVTLEETGAVPGAKEWRNPVKT